MKKLFHKGTLQEIGKVIGTQGQIVAYRVGNKLFLQNIEFLPSDAFKVEYKDGEVTIKCKLEDGDYLVVQDAKGMVDKSSLE